MKIKTANKFTIKGLEFFNLGIIFLPSAFPLGGFLILISLSISIFQNKGFFFKDKLNYTLLICLVLFISSCIKKSISFREIIDSDLPELPYSFNEYLLNNWIDLFNWIPFLLVFWGLQFYLDTSEKRLLCAKAITIGTVPVLISCIGEYWLGWNEKLSIFNGLIIWYQKDTEIMSGLFSNPNYAGLWLSMAWPFSYFLFLNTNKVPIKKITTLLILITISYVTVMTSSRNAIIGILISCILLIGKKFLFFAFLLVTLLTLFNFISNLLFSGELLKAIVEYLPKNLIDKFTRFDTTRNLVRIDMWKISLQAIFKKPIFGWGASTFIFLYLQNGGLYKDSAPTHSHNFILEVAYNYGLPVAIILTLFFTFLFWRVLAKKVTIIFKNNNIDKVWLASSLVVIFFFLTDFPYYDGRISIIFWVLMSGLKCIGDEKELF